MVKQLTKAYRKIFQNYETIKTFSLNSDMDA